MEDLYVCNLIIEYTAGTGELRKGTLLEQDLLDSGGFVVVDRDTFRSKLSEQGDWLWLWTGPGRAGDRGSSLEDGQRYTCRRRFLVNRTRMRTHTANGRRAQFHAPFVDRVDQVGHSWRAKDCNCQYDDDRDEHIPQFPGFSY